MVEQSKRLVAMLCCRAKPLSSQLSMLRGTWAMVVDHMLRMRAAWKNAMGCGVCRREAEREAFASLKRMGARRRAESWDVCLEIDAD